MRTDILERKEEILQWIAEEQPKAYMCKQLGCKQETLNSYLKKMGIEYAGQQAKKGQFKGSNVYRPAQYYIENNLPIQSYKLKDKETSFGIAFLSFSNSSILSNDEIEIYLERDKTQHPDNKIFGTFTENLKSAPLFRYDIVFKNKTSKIIYVDLANCFRTTNLGVSYCYYSSDIVTENKQSTSGGSFNLGGITNAAGIGGVAGSLANATTVGKSNSTSLSKTHINQRILQIPPKGKVCMSEFEYVTEKKQPHFHLAYMN